MSGKSEKHSEHLVNTLPRADMQRGTDRLGLHDARNRMDIWDSLIGMEQKKTIMRMC